MQQNCSYRFNDQKPESFSVCSLCISWPGKRYKIDGLCAEATDRLVAISHLCRTATKAKARGALSWSKAYACFVSHNLRFNEFELQVTLLGNPRSSRSSFGTYSISSSEYSTSWSHRRVVYCTISTLDSPVWHMIGGLRQLMGSQVNVPCDRIFLGSSSTCLMPCFGECIHIWGWRLILTLINMHNSVVSRQAPTGHNFCK
jgi:hypothetical protein